MTDIVLRYGSLLASGELNQRLHPNRLLMVQIKVTPVLPDIFGAPVRPALATPSIDKTEALLAAMRFVEGNH